MLSAALTGCLLSCSKLGIWIQNLKNIRTRHKASWHLQQSQWQLWGSFYQMLMLYRPGNCQLWCYAARRPCICCWWWCRKHRKGPYWHSKNAKRVQKWCSRVQNTAHTAHATTAVSARVWKTNIVRTERGLPTWSSLCCSLRTARNASSKEATPKAEQGRPDQSGVLYAANLASSAVSCNLGLIGLVAHCNHHSHYRH